MSQSDIKKIDIFVNGRSYTINCPASEEAGLQRSANYINQFVQDIRKHAPQLSQEELLVLCALNLYEKAEALQQHLDKEITAKNLIQSMIEDTQTLLK